MNRLEIFQKVYGADYVFTTQELEHLRQVTELIVRECAKRTGELGQSEIGQGLLKHFGVKE